MEGIKNTIIRNVYIEYIHDQRLQVCNSCDEKDDEGSSCAVTGTQPCCKLCGCSISVKTRSLSSDCPMKKWEAVITKEDFETLQKMK